MNGCSLTCALESLNSAPSLCFVKQVLAQMQRGKTGNSKLYGFPHIQTMTM
jgi:hypothetical protein